jgi:hypothetical protein
LAGCRRWDAAYSGGRGQEECSFCAAGAGHKGKSQHENGCRAAGVVYKLGGIAHDRGLFQQRLLVSARPQDEATRARAKAEDIALVEAAGLRQGCDTVKIWMENRI